MKRGERRSGLDGELIERQVVSRMVESPAEFVPPAIEPLPLARIDQIERHALEIAFGDSERGKSLRARVHAAKRLEAGIVEGLDTERHAVDAGSAISGKAFRLDTGGIGFQSNLGVGG